MQLLIALLQLAPIIWSLVRSAEELWRQPSPVKNQSTCSPDRARRLRGR